MSEQSQTPENNEPVADEDEVTAHSAGSVLDNQGLETGVDAASGSCVSLVSVVESQK